MIERASVINQISHQRFLLNGDAVPQAPRNAICLSLVRGIADFHVTCAPLTSNDVLLPRSIKNYSQSQAEPFQNPATIPTEFRRLTL